MQNPTFWVIASLGIGLLQAWDSNAFSSGPVVTLLALTGIVLPTAAIAMRVHQGLQIGVLIVGAVLLVAARLLAPESLNALHLALFPAAVYTLIFRGLFSNGQQQSV
jgi:hypothetical protein